jgi:undecaprenyl-diphosphatase
VALFSKRRKPLFRVARMRGALLDRDERLFALVARSELPLVGPALRPLSRAADNSLLWIVLSLFMASGGRRGRRAALRGIGSIAVASAVANQPAKRLFRRPRPAIDGHPAPRVIRRRLRTSSFPSGHSASAFAFAVGAGSELPRGSRVPLYVLASSVAFSRVYVGAHYPGDVLAGAALGAGAGRLSRRVWPLPEVEPGTGPARRTPADAPALRDGEGLHLVVNPGAGSEVELAGLRESLGRAEIVVRDEGQDLSDCLRAAGEHCRVLGVVGGDGSANAAATVALERGLPLLVVPGGTLNHLCRDLGFDDVEDAIAALGQGSAIRVDAGDLDGDLFINTASFGGYPEFVVDRERLESRLGKLPAMAVAGVRALWRAEPTEVEIDGETRRVWLIFIGNCRYAPDGPAPSVRACLDDGLLDVRMLDASRPGARLRLLSAVLLGRAHRSPALRAFRARRLSVRAVGAPLRTARDGEVCGETRDSFVVTKRVGALVLYASTDADG